MTQQPLYICIEGIIGSGKTTLTQQLNEFFQSKNFYSHTIYEQFQNNRILELFYQHPGKYNLLAEYSFLIDRFHQLSHCFQSSDYDVILSDFSFRKCLWFAETNLKPDEFQEYQKHFLLLENHLPKHPDLIIFLDVKPPQAYQNILARNRQMETPLRIDYLEKLYATYQKNIAHSPTPVEIIPIEKYDTLINDTLNILKKSGFTKI
ncbi:MAG: hypothetical protein KatS3mg034_0529 [Vicingaceae bacterium]|nr:MAG: hypothetical protein KatS3mg034_0529 [Vicingaceae bacterium]